MDDCELCNGKGLVKQETIYGDYGSSWVECPKCGLKKVVQKLEKITSIRDRLSELGEIMELVRQLPKDASSFALMMDIGRELDRLKEELDNA